MGDQQRNGTSAPAQDDRRNGQDDRRNGQQSGQRGTPPMTLLLRRPAQVVRHHVLAGLREAGFDDILPAHLGVFQHPGPDGVRPGILAARNQASKQAMNHLLHQLEEAGYLVRRPHATDRRTKVVKLTDRGWGALEVIRRVAVELEQSWADALGEDLYRSVRQGLASLERALEESMAARPGVHDGGEDCRTASGTAH